MIHARSSGGGLLPRWWARLAALVGSCVVIVVLAAQPALAQDILGADGSKDEGRIPADRYALTMPIGFDPAHGKVVSDDVFERVKRVGDTAMFMVAALFHDLGAMITRLGHWLIDLAFSFTVIEAIRTAVAAISRKMQSTFVAGIGLDHLAVFLAVFYCGIQLLRRRTAHSLGELAASMLIAVVGATLVAQPLRTLDTIAMTARSISVAMLDLASDDPVTQCGPPDNCSTERNPPPLTEQGYEIPKNMSDKLHEADVQIYDVNQFGQVLHGTCARTRDEYLRGEIQPIDDESDADDALVRVMWERGCREQVIYNTSMSFGRVGIALLTFVVRLVLFWFNATLSFSVMASQFAMGNVAAVMPVLVVAGTVPGTGRQIGLKGVNAVGQAVAGVVMSGFFLLLFVMFQTALLGLPGVSLLTRLTLVGVMLVTLWRYRGPVSDMIREIILHWTQRLKTKSPGDLAPNLLGDRELWENSIKKRFKENLVDSSYRGSRDFPRNAAKFARRIIHGKPADGGAPSGTTPPSGHSGTATAGAERGKRRFPTYTVVKGKVQQFGRDWKRRGQAVVSASNKTATVTGKGAKELARLSGQGFRGGLKLSRKAMVGAAGIAGALRNPETLGDAAGIAGSTAVAGAKAVRQGAKRTRDAAHYAHIYGGILAGDAVKATKKGRDAVEAGAIRAAMAGNAVYDRLHRSARHLRKDMSLSYAYRAHQTQSAIPGAAERDAQRRHRTAQREMKRRGRDVQNGRFLP